jgi:hypothetical protein
MTDKNIKQKGKGLRCLAFTLTGDVADPGVTGRCFSPVLGGVHESLEDCFLTEYGTAPADGLRLRPISWKVRLTISDVTWAALILVRTETAITFDVDSVNCNCNFDTALATLIDDDFSWEIIKFLTPVILDSETPYQIGNWDIPQHILQEIANMQNSEATYKIVPVIFCQGIDNTGITAKYAHIINWKTEVQNFVRKDYKP